MRKLALACFNPVKSELASIESSEEIGQLNPVKSELCLKEIATAAVGGCWLKQYDLNFQLCG